MVGPSGASVRTTSRRLRRELRQELVRIGLPADDLDALAQPECWLDERMCDRFRHHIGHADNQPHWSARGTAADQVEQLPPEREHVVGISEHRLSHLGWYDPATGAAQQFFAELLF
jgi:hypothetical protein